MMQLILNIVLVFTFQTRRFVSKWSAGLRIRVHPSLQSEMIGVIKPQGIISFIDEVAQSSVLIKFIFRSLPVPSQCRVWFCCRFTTATVSGCV